MKPRAWQEDGTLSARYWSAASMEMTEPSGIFYYWNGERPRHPTRPSSRAPARSSSSPPTEPSASGPPWADADPTLRARTSGVYLRAEPEDLIILDGSDQQLRADLIAMKLEEWRSIASS